MINNTNAWAVTVDNPKFSEAIQRIAFSFGYKWSLLKEDNKPQYTNATALYFYPNSKSILYGTATDISRKDVCRVSNTLEEVIENFNNPPSNSSIGKFQFYKDGSVLVGQMGRSVSIHKEEFDEAVVARNKFLGREDNSKKRSFPIIKFKYDSKTSKKKSVRQIILLGETEEYYNGLDMNDLKNPNSYKVFRKDCVLGDIQFIGFSEAKEW
jgi:hypothetical protein